jgi:hypothetical protein
MLAAQIMQHIPERANQLTSSRNHFTLGAQNTMIFTVICVVGLVVSSVATAHAIWVRGI